MTTGEPPGTPGHATAVARLLASIPVGAQNRGALRELVIDGRPALEVAVEIAQDPDQDPPARQRCLQALRRLDDAAVRELHLRLVGDAEVTVAHRALQGLLEDRPSRELVEPLLAHLQRRPAATDAIVKALAELGAEEAAPAIAAYGQEGPGPTEKAVAALRRITRRDLGAEIEPYLAHLQEPASRPRVDRLREDLQHSDPGVRRWAVEDLALLGDPAAVPALLEMAEAGGPEAHAAARLALRFAPHRPELARDARAFRDGHWYPKGLLEALRETV